MEMQKFEDILSKMTKPEVSELKHEEILAKAITKVKDKSAVSLWWLSIPLYLIAAFAMKSFYVPGSSISTTFHELKDTKGYTAILLFIVLPLTLIIINLFNIKQIYFLYGNSSKASFIKIIFIELLIIILSLIILIAYSL